ncbi:hypothetical protein GWK47_025061 [Chionoecetes opilio]|uniref:Uncharacterized protein n=1 Tax=Chionoecetes opilio TaxID=41210 RepID=A0A8J4XPE0_CHIOP|nr:hypothetical protein GWK47_025061 [Chionoecetes opilio]KAG0702584.1 hypothetical protein GWK47_025061 [Chionoecetes opilio]
MVPMPRNYQPRNILTTDRTNLEKAFNHRIETGCSIRTACNLFGVKVSTLGDAFTRSLKESDGGRSCLSTRTSRRFSLMRRNTSSRNTRSRSRACSTGCRRELSGGWS